MGEPPKADGNLSWLDKGDPDREMQESDGLK